MKNVKGIWKSVALLSVLALVLVAAPAKADNGNDFLNLRASLKTDALVKLESATGVVLGPNGTLRVLNAKVTSVADGVVNASAAFGSSSLNFVVKADANTKVNGRASSVDGLKAGDKVSFAGTISSSSASSIEVKAEHIISRALLGKANKENSYKGEIKAVTTADNSLTVTLGSGKEVKVILASSAVVAIDGSVKSLADLKVGDEVKIVGELSADGSTITASKISMVNDDKDGDNDRDGDRENGDKSGKENGGWLLRLRSWFQNR